MKAITYKEKGQVELQTVPEPQLKDHGAIIKVKACGLCGSDIVKLKHGLFEEGAVPGHEVVGFIHKIKSPEQEKHFKVGDRVVLGHHVPCYNCVYCKNGNYSMCHAFKKSNIIPGGFCEYIYVSEKHLENTLFKIPDNLSDEYASFTEPSACCLRAVKRAAVNPEDVVFVIGLGSIGILMGQILMHFGATVIACDLLDERVKIAKELGFSSVYKFTNTNEISELIKSDFQKEGADKVFLTSGSANSLSFGLTSVRDGGTILVFASIPDYDSGFANNDIYYRELTIAGSYSPSPADLREALLMIKDGIIKLEGLFTVYEMEDIKQAIEDTCSNRIIKAIINISSTSLTKDLRY